MTTRNSPLDSLDRSLRALEGRKRELIHIRQLRFPNYRNLEKDSKLPFEFPITVLLGRNGANKSSVLHALYGSVRQNTIADFWFETSLDAIPETRDGLKQSVAHTYVDESGQEVESIKARAPRSEADPDYWEAVKPTVRYGFPKGARRVSPISLPVKLLDFRSELPAFDKYFYFPDPIHLRTLARRARERKTLRREYRKQDYLRHRAPLVKRRMDTDAEQLTEHELQVLRYVLERDYAAGAILTHDIFHGHVGRTIRFSTLDFENGYTDAFAGSGESAAAFLIHDVMNAAPHSLILLDEPETSLHPRAQRRMLEFICHQAVRKSLQVVMATHSVHFAANLPQSAIRVLELTNVGRIRVVTTYTAREALHEIDSLPPGRVAIVEDERAKHLLLSGMDRASLQAKNEIQVLVREGGTSRIFRDIQAYVNSGKDDLFVMLDGDHRPSEAIPLDGALPQGMEDLSRLISRFTKGPSSAGPQLAFVDAAEATRYARFLRDRVHFLPGQAPEDLVWSATAADDAVRKRIPTSIVNEASAKRRIHLAAELLPGLDADALFKLLVVDFLLRESDELHQLDNIVAAIRR